MIIIIFDYIIKIWKIKTMRKIREILILTFIVTLSNFFLTYSQEKRKTESLSGEQSLVLESFIVGDGANNYLGSAVSAEGDFNGDGVNDLVIGANGAGRNREGRIYVFYGKKFPKNLFASNADLIINGEKNGDSFGWSVSFESDVNKDGFTDLLVGAISTNEEFEKTGTVYLFYGKNITGEISASKADKKFVGIRKEQFFGWSISSGSDINGDGNIDIVVGAVGNSKYKDGIMAGGVYAFFGNKFEDTTKADEADIVISGEKYSSHMGNSVSIKGDVNGDGVDDLLAGAFFCDLDGYRGGRAYLFYGKKNFKKDIDASDADLIIRADGRDEWIGNKVRIIPDINGDKLSDFMVSAPGKDTEHQDSGVAYVFYGGDRKGKIRASEADLILKGKPVGRKFGSYISSLGDIDGDGRVDLAISEPGGEANPREMLNLGSVYFFLSTLLKEKEKAIDGFAISGPKPDTEFGNSISLNDVDGDGIKEVIISSYYENINGDKSGAVFIYKWLIKRR